MAEQLALIGIVVGITPLINRDRADRARLRGLRTPGRRGGVSGLTRAGHVREGGKANPFPRAVDPPRSGLTRIDVLRYIDVCRWEEQLPS
jgi:hypothetical protein